VGVVLFLGDMIGAIRVLLVHVLVNLCHLLIVGRVFSVRIIC
jgi:hypothetical protein